MTPSELSQLHEWLEKVGGVIRAPDAPTCRNGGRTIDYIVVDRRISAAVVSVALDLGVLGRPHSAVVVRLRCVATRAVTRMLVRPKAFPTDRPIGCCREPRPPDMGVHAALQEATRSQPFGYYRVVFDIFLLSVHSETELVWGWV